MYVPVTDQQYVSAPGRVPTTAAATMSSQDQGHVEAAASLFASQNGSGVELFDSYFNEAENNIENQTEPSHESSNAEAASLFDAGIDESASLFTDDSSTSLFPPIESAEDIHVSSEPETGTDPYEKEAPSTGYYNFDHQAGPTEYADQSQTYGNSCEAFQHEPNDTYSMSYYQSGQTNQWTDYATPSNGVYNVTHTSQTSVSSQYSYPQQIQHSAPKQDHTPLLPYQPEPSNSQYSSSSNGFISPIASYSIPEPAKVVNPNSTLTAYRPKTSNAYDPPIPTKSRTKSRYASPTSSLNYTSFQSNQTFGIQPADTFPSQSSVALQGGQDTRAFSSEFNPLYSELEYGDSTQTTAQPNQGIDIANKNLPIVGADDIDFESGTDSLHQKYPEYLHPEAGAELASFTNPGSYLPVPLSSATEPVEQESFPASHLSGLQPQSDMRSATPENASHIQQQDLVVPPQHSYVPHASYIPPLNTADAPPRSSFHNLQRKEDQNDSIANSAIVDHPASKVTFLPISTSAPHAPYAPYAPSPTLIGANDPLGRTSVRAPIVSFGLGGKLVLCFHLPQDAGGFDVSLTAHQTTFVAIRPLTEVLPVSAMESNVSSFPGPLFSDPGASSLARTVGVGITGQTKNKKAALITWLEERIVELANGLAYIASGSSERYRAEGRLVLLTLLKVMVENDGQLSGSSSIEWAVRSALIPRLQNEAVSAGDDSLLGQSLYTPYLSMTESTEQTMAVHYAKNSSLDRIREFLIRGEKLKAYHFAMDEKLWAHAMLIANSVDAQSFKEVAKEFIHSELGVKHILHANSEQTPQANGKESLRVAYSLLSGHGASSIQELFPSTSLSSNNVTSAGAQFTPMTPSFQPERSLVSLPPSGVLEQSLTQWQETASMIFTQSPGDSAALTSLGDYLTANRWFEAAHVCYLLSPRTSSFGGINVPSVRMVLVGSESPATLPNFHKDLDVTLLSEIAEFSLSLSTVKGQDTFSGLPHLQAYKLLRAYFLAEMGYVEAANRYCEAIGNTIRASPRGSQSYTPAFIGALKDLSDRLTAIPQSDKPGSWISRTMAKPSFDTIGSWLEGRFSKIIVGEGEENVPSPSKESQAKATFGPFSHYSSISSAAPSAPPSRSATPYATGNALSTASIMSQYPIDRAVSAFDYARLDRRRSSPIQRVVSASAVTPPVKSQGENSITNSLSQHRSENGVIDAYAQENTWWGSTSSNDPTPTAAGFNPVPPEELQGEFISPMDNVPPGFTFSSSRQSASVRSETSVVEEEEEDLGFGNTSFKKSQVRESPIHEREGGDVKEQPKPKNERTVSAEKPVTKPELVQQSSSWFGSLWSWKRGNSQSPAPGPIVANLGEEKSFYYDKELKRWVNKNAPDTSAASTPPPPPPRAQTASPSVALSHTTSTEQSGMPSPPPPRSSSALEPPRKPPRVRSNLVPQEEIPVPSSAPPVANSFDPPGLGNGMPPANRPKSSASKRNVRNRYVDVFQQNA